jgi:fructose-specific phosphotransferase system IIC component
MMPPSTSLNSAVPTLSDAPLGLTHVPTASPTAELGQPIAIVLAQSDPDVLADIGNAFKGFYESGQLWALLIGFIVGYVVRGITTYK